MAKYDLKFLKGDLIKLADAGKFDIIIHGVDCYAIFLLGLSKEIKTRWPESKAIDQRTKKGDPHKLGSYTIASVKTKSGGSLLILNMYTQYKPGKDFKLLHLEQCLLRLQGMMRANVSIGMSDKSFDNGQEWESIEESLRKNFNKLDLTVVIK